MWIQSQDLERFITEMERRASDHQLTSETEYAFSEWEMPARAHVRRMEELAMPNAVKDSSPGENPSMNGLTYR